MRKLLVLFISIITLFSCSIEFPMSYDKDFDTTISIPKYRFGEGPLIVIDGSHNNFFTVTGLIQPLTKTLISDGYRVITNDKKFTEELLSKIDIIVITTPMSRSYKNFIQSYKGAFKKKELRILQTWVEEGGSLLMFSEHFPFDDAIKPLLETFEIETSIGQTIDPEFSEGGLIIFENERLESTHPIVSGKREVNKLASYGGSSLTGKNYTNLLYLSENSKNIERQWVFSKGGPIGKGNSQGIAGNYGAGKIVAFGDANGFTALVFDEGNGIKTKAGMNDEKYDWRNFVLNTFDWLSGSQ